MVKRGHPNKMSKEEYKMWRRRRIFIARAKIITILVLTVFISIFICSLAMGVFSEHSERENNVESVSDNKIETNNSTTSTTSSQIDTKSTTESTKKVEKVAFSSEYSFKDYNKNCDWSMIVVNSHNSLPEGYKVNTTEYKGFDVDVRIVNQLSSMLEAAQSDGIDLWVSSAYRSNETQVYLYDRETDYYKDMGYSEAQAKQLAKKSVAVPGTSEHEVGLAVDFNNVTDDFKYTQEYAWLCQHAAEYGFIQRYPEGKENITDIIFEPWHYRYVGKENAEKINASGKCLEEYVYNLINK